MKINELRDVCNRLIALSYELERGDKAEMNDLLINFDALREEFNEIVFQL